MLCVAACREECLPFLILWPSVSLVWQSRAYAVRPFVKDLIMRALLVVICLQTVAARSGPDAVATLPAMQIFPNVLSPGDTQLMGLAQVINVHYDFAAKAFRRKG